MRHVTLEHRTHISCFSLLLKWIKMGAVFQLLCTRMTVQIKRGNLNKASTCVCPITYEVEEFHPGPSEPVQDY